MCACDCMRVSVCALETWVSTPDLEILQVVEGLVSQSYPVGIGGQQSKQKTNTLRLIDMSLHF